MYVRARRAWYGKCTQATHARIEILAVATALLDKHTRLTRLVNMKLHFLVALLALLCLSAESANMRTWSKERIPSLLEVSAKLKTGSPASEILEMLMKLSHIHTHGPGQ